jgi:DNA repair exonuclease SbcCD ATPase subunit
VSDELEQLRADLEVLERYNGGNVLFGDIQSLKSRILELEAAADPWREAKAYFDQYRKYQSLSSDARQAIAFYDHLTAEVARLAKENAALGKRLETVNRELAKAIQDERDTYEELCDRAAERDAALKRVAGLEKEMSLTNPVLDPARVMATAEEIMKRIGWASAFCPDQSHFATALHNHAFGAKPYPLKGCDK